MIERYDLLEESEVNNLAQELEPWQPEEILRWAIERFGRRLAVATSFQAEGMVLLDMAWRIDPRIRVISVDSGRLHPDTYDLIERVRTHYQISIEMYYPNSAELESFVRREGINPFYRGTHLRKRCCEIRKVNPLKKVLDGLDAWISGLRRDQWSTRSDVAKAEIDHDHGGLLKLNPLASWTLEQVWEYTREHDVPHNSLYDKGYRSIGCEPCTRATQPGEDPRAGRWWWEKSNSKECGIHFRL